MIGLVKKLEGAPRWVVVLSCLALLALVGLGDFRAGFEIHFSVFYVLVIALATWGLSKRFGLFMSVLSVAAWITGDLVAGAHYSTSFVPVWNMAILLAFYFIVVWLLASLRSLRDELENRVQQRTVALRQEMAERERLEKEILDVSEREQRRIGRDLHDSLCQHLTGTALAGQVLEEKLAAKSLSEASDARKVVELVEDGIALARKLARGIAPVQMEAEGLSSAFRDFASNITNLSKIVCTFDSDPEVVVRDASTAMHLYRIAQEASSNAIRHGKAQRIWITLTDTGGHATLSIEDDGVGLSETWQHQRGLGTRIMAHRAAMIGASFSIEPNPTGGTLVKCSLPSAPHTFAEGESVPA